MAPTVIKQFNIIITEKNIILDFRIGILLDFRYLKENKINIPPKKPLIKYKSATIKRLSKFRRTKIDNITSFCHIIFFSVALV